MILKNSTNWSDRFLRRMLSWVCRELHFPIRKVRQAKFTKYRGSYRGLAHRRRILVRIGDASRFPTASHVYKRQTIPAYADPLEALVAVTAHETGHMVQYENGWDHHYSHNEPGAVACEVATIATFRAKREELIAAWSKEMKTRTIEPKSKPSIVEQRAAKVEAQLLRWERKLKLAKTKVAKLRAKVKYYERRSAAKKDMKSNDNCRND